MNKKIIIVMVMLCLVISLVSAEMYDGKDTGELAEPYKANLKVVNGVFTRPTFFEALFGGQSFNFVDKQMTSLADYDCTYTHSSNKIYWSRNSDLQSGAVCDNGQFIVYFNNDISHELFDELWWKKTTTDLPNFLNYDVKHYFGDGMFYSYHCYDCNFPNIEDSFEKGCLSNDKTECVGVTDPKCDDTYWYGFESECLKHITRPAMYDITITESPEEVKVNEIYKVKGYLEVTNGDLSDAIIESGINYYGSVFTQPFTIIDESNKGQCGNDLTIGVKFNAIGNNRFYFTLTDNARVDLGTYKVPVYFFDKCAGTVLSQDTYSVKVVKEDVPPPNDEVTCYWCEDGTLQTKTYSAVNCPEGQSTERVSCDPCDLTPNSVACDPDYCENNPEALICIATCTIDSCLYPTKYSIPSCEGNWKIVSEEPCLCDWECNELVIPIWVYILIGVGVLLLIGGLLFKTKTKRGKK